MIDVTNEVRIYDEKDSASDPKRLPLLVKSHWNRSELVDLEMYTTDGHTFRLTVKAQDLQCAIVNATNVNRF